MPRLQVPVFELERLQALYGDPTSNKPGLEGPTVSLVIEPPPLEAPTPCAVFNKICTLEPRPGLECPFYALIVTRYSSKGSITLAQCHEQLHALALEVTPRVRNAFAGQDLRGIYSYTRVSASNDDTNVQSDLDDFVTSAGSQGITIRLILIGLDALLAAELLAVNIDLWLDRTAIELMVYQHHFPMAIASHPIRQKMTLSDWP